MSSELLNRTSIHGELAERFGCCTEPGGCDRPNDFMTFFVSLRSNSFSLWKWANSLPRYNRAVPPATGDGLSSTPSILRNSLISFVFRLSILESYREISLTRQRGNSFEFSVLSFQRVQSIIEH